MKYRLRKSNGLEAYFKFSQNVWNRGKRDLVSNVGLQYLSIIGTACKNVYFACILRDICRNGKKNIRGDSWQLSRTMVTFRSNFGHDKGLNIKVTKT